MLRDIEGTVHSISNGTIRVSSNLTRIYAVAMVDIEGVKNRDVEAVIAIMDRVGREMAADPAWADLIVEAPHYRSTPAFTDLGVTLRMATKVRPAGRWSVPAELRRQLALAFSSAGIRLNRRTARTTKPGPRPTTPPGPARSPRPEPDRNARGTAIGG